MTMLVKLVCWSQNQSTINFSRFSTFLKFGIFYGEPVWLNVIVKYKIKKYIEIWTVLTTTCLFLPIVTFDTIQGHHNLKFTFSQLFLDYLLCPAKTRIS